MPDDQQSTADAEAAAELSKEQEVLQAMRKVLGGVVRDTTPEHRGMRHVLSDKTIEDIKHCFALISVRERELHELKGVTHFAKPAYPDTPRTTQSVGFTPVKKPGEDEIH